MLSPSVAIVLAAALGTARWRAAAAAYPAGPDAVARPAPAIARRAVG